MLYRAEGVTLSLPNFPKQLCLLLNRFLAEGTTEHHPAVSASQVFPVAENAEFLQMTAAQFARHDVYSCSLNPSSLNAERRAVSLG